MIRGARQVGKTWLIRALAATTGKTLIEINFENQSNDMSLFAFNDPQKILGSITENHFSFYIEPALYYWAREEKNASAEIDYIIQRSNHIIPIEVKGV